jgi:DNA-binding transcriptional LysR family regulator
MDTNIGEGYRPDKAVDGGLCFRKARTMLKLDGLAAFVAVADAGSITEAARRMGVSKSVLSDRLAELERSVGARLLQRTTRKIAVTEDGAAFLERARRIVRDATDATAELAERRGALAGPLRISAPVSFGSLHLGAALFPFLDANPGIDLTLELDDRFVDVASDGYDAVVRHGPVRDNRLMVKRLAASRRFLVASPAYLATHGTPQSPADLESCSALLYSNRETDWRFTRPDDADDVVVRPRKCLRVNNGLVMRDAAIAGMGIALLPTFICYTGVASDALRIVDVGLQAEGSELYLAYPADRRPSAKIRALAEHLQEAFGDPPYWETEMPKPKKPPGRRSAVTRLRR